MTAGYLDYSGRDDVFSVAALAALERGLANAPGVHNAPPLTRREFEVAQLAAQGLTNRQIAETLVITEKTAANHPQHSLGKLDLRSRTRLAARAAEFGLRPAGRR